MALASRILQNGKKEMIPVDRRKAGKVRLVDEVAGRAPHREIH